MYLLDSPGLGIELNEEEVKKHPRSQKTKVILNQHLNGTRKVHMTEPGARDLLIC